MARIVPIKLNDIDEEKLIFTASTLNVPYEELLEEIVRKTIEVAYDNVKKGDIK